MKKTARVERKKTKKRKHLQKNERGMGKNEHFTWHSKSYDKAKKKKRKKIAKKKDQDRKGKGETTSEK